MKVGFLDLQTTGRHPADSEIIEVGFSTKGSSWSEYIRRENVDASLIKLLDLKEKTLQTARLEKKVISRLQQEIDSCDLVAIYYARFELGFLKKLEVKGLEKVVCLYDLSRRLIRTTDRFNIKALSNHLGFSLEGYRAHDHVLATRWIWDKMELNVFQAPAELQAWREKHPIAKIKKRPEVDLPKRKTLPKTPGVYRFISAQGTVLYVGKATNLKTRVASYFTGYKQLAGYKKDLVHLTKDIEFEVCKTPAHAAMREVELIHRIDPMFNRALTPKQKTKIFLNRELEWCEEAGELGPFYDHGFVVDLESMVLWLKGELSLSDLFYLAEIEEDLEVTGRSWLSAIAGSGRELIAWGLVLDRWGVPDKRDEDEPSTPETSFQLICKLQRWLIRLSRRYRETRKLMGVTDVILDWEDGSIALGESPLNSSNAFTRYRVLQAEKRSLIEKFNKEAILVRVKKNKNLESEMGNEGISGLRP